jgi:RNA polymerase sigma factor (sigma-70 family)
LRDERSRLVQKALERMPHRDAELLILKYGEGFGAREIAERLGVSVATIETRLHRARGRLRALLSGLAEEFEAKDHE